MIARELLIKLGFNIDTAKLDKFSGLVDNAKNKMNSLKTNTIEAFSVGADSKIAALIAYREELKSLNKEERRDVLELNKLEQQVLKQNAADREEKIKAQQKLRSQAFGQIRSFSRQIAIFSGAVGGAFALSLRSTLKDAASFKQAGGSSKDNANSFTPAQIATVDSFNAAIYSTKKILNDLRNSFVIDMLPAITEFVEAFRSWVKQNRELIKGKLKNLIEGLAKAFSIFSSIIIRIVSIFDAVISRTFGWERVITALITIGVSAWLINLATSIGAAATAFRVLSAAMLANPIIAIIAAITLALGFLVDEIYVTLKGGDSFINDFLNSKYWQVAKSAIDAIIDSMKELYNIATKAWNSVTNFDSVKNIGKNVKDLFSFGKKETAVDPESGLLRRHTKSGRVIDVTMPQSAERRATTLALPQSNLSSAAGHSSIHNASNNIVNRNSFNMNINVAEGTTAKQAKEIVTLVRAEIERSNTYENEKTLTAIGAY